MRIDSPWWLSVDVGTSNTTAGLVTDDGDAHALPLTDHSLWMPSAVRVRSPTQLAAGEAALAAAPGGLVAAPKRWITAGRTSFELGGTTVPAHTVIAALLRAVTARMHQRYGRAPAGLTLTHPESWAPQQVQVLTDAAAEIGVPGPLLRLVSEPSAAARYLLRNERPAPGTRIGIVDFGAATLNVTVLVTTAGSGFQVVATQTDTNLGGNNIDAAIRRWVDARLAQRDPALLAQLGDHGTTPAARAVEQVIRHGKEELSQTLSTDIPIRAGKRERVLTMTRDEFDALVAPEITRVSALARTTLERAGVRQPSELHALYLTGGSSRIPLLRRQFVDIGPVAMPDDPQTVVARGALVFPGPPAAAEPERVAPPPDPPAEVGLTPLPAVAAPGPEPVAAQPVWWRPLAPPFAQPGPVRRGRRGLWAGIAAAAGGVAVVAVGAAMLLPDRDQPAPRAATAVTATLATGELPEAIAIDPGTGTAFVKTTGGNALVVSLPTRATVATVADAGTADVDVNPGGVAVDAATHLVYTVDNDRDGGGALTVIDPAKRAAVARIAVGRQPADVVVDAARHTAYVANSDDGTVSVVDLRARAVRTTVPVGKDPAAVALDPVAHAVYVLNTGDGTVSVLDTGTRSVTATIDIGRGAKGFAVDPGGHTIYLTLAGADGGYAVKAVDTAGHAVTATIPIAGNPGGIAVDPAAHALYVTDLLDNTVTVLETVSHGVIATVPVGKMPGAVAVDPATHRAYVANAGSLTQGTITVLGPS